MARLEALGEQLDGGNIALRRIRADDRPIAGTRLVREYQGVEHVVTVLADGFEYEGRPYRSLSAIARAITGTRWNGWTFFGLRGAGRRMSRRTGAEAAAMPADRPEAPLRGLHAQEHRGGAGAGVQHASTPSATPARPTWPASGPRAGCWSPDRYDDGGFSGGTLERPALQRLLADIEAGPVDVVVVYKIDRLSAAR